MAGRWQFCPKTPDVTEYRGATIIRHIHIRGT
jgi:hypothetical protein